MPATTGRQARTMQACRHGATYQVCKKIRRSMSPKEMKKFSYVSHMPKGASQSPKGDISRNSDKEYWAQRHFKESGSMLDSQAAFGSNTGTPGKIGDCDGMGSY